MNLPSSDSTGPLPPELLIKIVHELIRYGPMQDRLRLGRRPDKALRPLCLVSTAWKNIITSCPELWSTLSTLYSTNALEMFVQRSGTAPLHIIVERTRPTAMLEFMEVVRPTSARWASYSSLFINDYSLLACPHPKLERLCILGTTAASVESIHLPASVEHQLLERLRLTVIPLEFGGRSWNHLRELRLKELYDFILRPSQLVELLSNSPYLEMLALEQIVEGGREGDVESRKTILLPSLTRLEMFDIGSQIYHTVMQRIETPNLQQCCIKRIPADYAKGRPLLPVTMLAIQRVITCTGIIQILVQTPTIRLPNRWGLTLYTIIPSSQRSSNGLRSRGAFSVVLSDLETLLDAIRSWIPSSAEVRCEIDVNEQLFDGASFADEDSTAPPAGGDGGRVSVEYAIWALSVGLKALDV